MSKKTVLARVPKEIVMDADNFRKQIVKDGGPIITRTEAMRRLRGFIKFGKKGQFIEFMFVMVILVMALVLFGVINFGVVEFNKTVQANDEDAEYKTLIQQRADSIPGWWDFGFAILFFIILLFIVLANLSLETNVQQIIFIFFLLLFIGPMFVAGHNQLNAVLTAMPTAFEKFVLTTFIVNQFYIIMALFYILQFMIIFVKPQQGRFQS